MPCITVMSWNLKDCGPAKSVPRFAQLIAEIMRQNNVGLAGFLELEGGAANVLDGLIAAELNGGGGGVPWHTDPSVALGAGNSAEQYLFVWDTTSITQAGASIHAFTNAVGGAPLYFPNQRNRSPYLGTFQPVGTALALQIAVYHAPAPMGRLPHSEKINYENRRANRALGQAQQLLAGGNACVCMGDFNVKDNPTERMAFDRLAPNFTEHLQHDLTSLKDATAAGSVPPPTTLAQVTANAYDKFFCRSNPAPTGNVTFQNARVLQLIPQMHSGGPLEAHLAALENAVTGGAVAGYATFADAFGAFRTYVSDHLPIAMEFCW